MNVLKRTVLAACLAAAFPAAQAANVVVTPGGVAGYMYLTPEASSGGGSSGTAAGDVDCTVPFVSNYTKTFVAGEVTKDLVINYWMKGAGGAGAYSVGGSGAAVSSSFTIPSGYVGSLAIWVGRGGGVGEAVYGNYYAGGRGGDGYAGGGGGGFGYGSCSNCVYSVAGGGGGGSSAITLGGPPQAIAGGGGGGGGIFGGSGAAGNGVGASGGGGGGGQTAGSSGSDTKGGIWNGVAPASSGGSGSTTMYTRAVTTTCEPDGASERGGGGFGGTNGGGGGGGGGGHYSWYSGSCVFAKSGGGGGGGGAGGGGGGGGGNNTYYGVGFATFAELTGAAGGAYGAAGLAAPDTTADATTHAGGFGGAFNSAVGGTWPGHSYNMAAFTMTQAPVGTYGTDPYVFLQDKGLGGARAYYNGTIVVPPSEGSSGGVFIKYAAPACIIQPPI